MFDQRYAVQVFFSESPILVKQGGGRIVSRESFKLFDAPLEGGVVRLAKEDVQLADHMPLRGHQVGRVFQRGGAQPGFFLELSEQFVDARVVAAGQRFLRFDLFTTDRRKTFSRK